MDRSVSVGHILTTLAAVAGFFVWAMAQEKRIVRLEEHAVASSKADEAQNDERKVLRQEIRDELREIRSMLEARPKR